MHDLDNIYVEINLPDFYRPVSTGTNHSSDGSIDLVTSWDKGYTVGSESDRGWYQDADSFWHYGDKNGQDVTGWLKIKDNRWYFLEQGGKMATGWQYINDEWYYMTAEEQTWYYLNSSGAML